MNRLDWWRLRRFYNSHIQEIGETFTDWIANLQGNPEILGIAETLKLEKERFKKRDLLLQKMNIQQEDKNEQR